MDYILPTIRYMNVHESGNKSWSITHTFYIEAIPQLQLETNVLMQINA